MKTTGSIIKTIRIIRNRLACEKGQIAVIAALVLIVAMGMMAFVIDEGSVYQTRRDLQTVADSAALSGAQELPKNPALAVQAAVSYAALNNFTISSSDVVISNTYVNNDTIIVTAVNPSTKLYFAGIFGQNTATVAATATAMVGRPENFTGVVPWGVVQDKWVPGVEYPLNEDKFGALSFNGESTGGSVYRDNIANGYSGTLEIGSMVDFLNGFKSGPTIQGTESRIGPPPLDTFSDLTDPLTGGGFTLAKPDSQFVFCPIVSQATAAIGHGPIIGFAPFVITYNTNKIVYGTFLNEALIVYNGSILAVNETGIKVVRLIN
jgi:Flp pilus assembly protein TadG